MFATFINKFVSLAMTEISLPTYVSLKINKIQFTVI